MRFTSCLLIACVSAIPLPKNELSQTETQWGWGGFSNAISNVVESVADTADNALDTVSETAGSIVNNGSDDVVQQAKNVVTEKVADATGDYKAQLQDAFSVDTIKDEIIEEVQGNFNEEELAAFGAKFAFDALMKCVPQKDLMKAAVKIQAGGDQAQIALELAVDNKECVAEYAIDTLEEEWEKQGWTQDMIQDRIGQIWDEQAAQVEDAVTNAANEATGAAYQAVDENDYDAIAFAADAAKEAKENGQSVFDETLAAALDADNADDALAYAADNADDALAFAAENADDALAFAADNGEDALAFAADAAAQASSNQ